MVMDIRIPPRKPAPKQRPKAPSAPYHVTVRTHDEALACTLYGRHKAGSRLFVNVKEGREPVWEFYVGGWNGVIMGRVSRIHMDDAIRVSNEAMEIVGNGKSGSAVSDAIAYVKGMRAQMDPAPKRKRKRPPRPPRPPREPRERKPRKRIRSSEGTSRSGTGAPDGWMGWKEAAMTLGVTRTTFFRHVSKGILPISKIGSTAKGYWYNREDVMSIAGKTSKEKTDD